MSFGENIKKSLNVLVFNEKALTEISNNEKATGYGFLTLIIAGVATAIASLNIIGIILNPIAVIIGLFIGYSIYHFIAKLLLGGKATGAQYFRSLSNSFIVYWFTFIPILGIFLQMIAGLWLIAINVFILNKVHKLSILKSVLLGLLPIIVGVILFFIGVFSYFQVLAPNAYLPGQ